MPTSPRAKNHTRTLLHPVTPLPLPDTAKILILFHKSKLLSNPYISGKINEQNMPLTQLQYEFLQMSIERARKNVPKQKRCFFEKSISFLCKYNRSLLYFNKNIYIILFNFQFHFVFLKTVCDPNWFDQEACSN